MHKFLTASIFRWISNWKDIISCFEVLP